jgi:hypothetical protein
VDDRGYASVLALALLLGGVLLVGLASDLARLVVAWQNVSQVAHAAAEAGAGWVDPDALYRGELAIDPRGARRAGHRVLDDHGLTGVVEVASDRVCVTASRSLRPGLIRIVGAVDQVVAVRACAEPRQG